MAQAGPLLRSQRLRMVNHPGTFHFRELVEEVSNGVYEAGGKPGVFAVSDICDGVVQATDGMSYSLISRDIMAAMVEIHALAHPHDGMVLISGNDKSVPAHLVAMARCDLPAIHLPGGTQLNAPGYVTSDTMWAMGATVERGELPRQDLDSAQRGACPTCGACQFMGSASTGQVLAEALGLALPGSALVPAPLTKLRRYARATGKQLVTMINQNLTARRILTRDAFENAIILHAAIGGSTNALLHIPVIAREAGVEVTIDDFDRIHRRVPVLANVKTTGRYPVEYFWYPGGVPAVMLELREMLHLNCLTVTGKTLGENLEEIERNPFFFAERRGYLNNLKIDKEEIISPRSEPFATDGGGGHPLWQPRPGRCHGQDLLGTRGDACPHRVGPGLRLRGGGGPRAGQAPGIARGCAVEINAPERRLAIVGVKGEHRPADEVEEILTERRRIWKPPRPRHDSGILSLYERVARGTSEGASLT
jgi:dihydroxy-acid dehydratase